MAATRFYFYRSTSPPVSPAFDANWEVTAGASPRGSLIVKTETLTLESLFSIAATTTTGTTQDSLNIQLVSPPIPPQRITGTFSLVTKVSENATTDNVTLAVNVRVVSQDGGTVRGTLFSAYGTDTEVALLASAATRIVNAQAITALTTQPGDRIVIELGGHTTASTTTGNCSITLGSSASSDYALTSGLTTSLNPWCEFSQDLFATQLNNYQSIKVGDGMGTGERIR